MIIVSSSSTITTSYLISSYKQNAITCMETMNKSHDNDRAVGMVVFGTECKQLIILEPSASNVQKLFELPSVPTMISISGCFEVEHRIFVACRNACVYTIKVGLLLCSHEGIVWQWSSSYDYCVCVQSGKLSGSPIEMEHDICAMACIEKSLLVACIDRSVQSYGFKGKRMFTVFLPAPILEIAAMSSSRCILTYTFIHSFIHSSNLNTFSSSSSEFSCRNVGSCRWPTVKFASTTMFVELFVCLFVC